MSSSNPPRAPKGPQGGDVIHGRNGGDVIHGRNGGDVIHGRNGGDVIHSRHGGDVIHTRNGGSIEHGHDGHIRQVHTRDGLSIGHGPRGERTTRYEGHDHRIVETHGRGCGYVQEPRVRIGGCDFVHRTYVENGQICSRAYREFSFHGVSLAVYTPLSFFTPGFYDWAETPWVVGARYRWSWLGSPWLLMNRGYFAPEPVYASAPQWLTDYVVGSNLQASYQPDAPAAPVTPACGCQITTDVKQQIAAEVRAQIAQEMAEARSASQTGSVNATPTIFDGNKHVFVASSSMIVDGANQQCAINQGDVLQFNGAQAVSGSDAYVQVLASQPQDCQMGSFVSLPIDQLQEMQNQMRATVDQGLQDLRSQGGRSGLPVVPATSMVAAPYASQMPPVDQNVAQRLQQQRQESIRAEQEVLNQAQPHPAPAAHAQTFASVR